MIKINVNYQDWSSSSRDMNAWRMATLDLTYDVDPLPQIEIHLTRDALKNTFSIILGESEARLLHKELGELLAE